jgi:hypothetical protein
MDFRTLTRARKCSEPDTDRRSANRTLSSLSSSVYRKCSIQLPGQAEYKHENEEIYHVTIEMAGMGTKRVRLANLPLETPDEAVRLAFSTYGEIKEIQERWSRAYRCQVADSTRVVLLTALTKHIPSHMTIAGNRVLVSYEGQPTTCYGCGEKGHLYLVCPRRRKVGPAEAMSAHIVGRHCYTWAYESEG